MNDKKNTFDYKTYMKEMYGLEESIITESPVRYAGTLHKTKSDVLVTREMAMKIQEKGKNIGRFKITDNTSFEIYEYVENGTICFNLLDNNQPPLLVMCHTVREFNGGIESLDIWQSMRNMGLARWWIFGYILKHYKFMMSDRLHTSHGEQFWKSLIEEGLEKKLNIFVINIKTNEKFPITNVGEMDNYYGNNTFEFRFVIEA